MALRLGDGVERLPGIGPARARSLEKLGLATVEDLLRYFPRDYEDRRRFSTVAAAPVDTPVCLELLVAEPPHLSRIRKGLELVKARLVDDTGSVTATFFNQSYMKDALRTGETYVVYGRVEGPPGRRQMTNPVCERADRARFTGRILPIYPLTRGISNNLLAGLTLRCVEECAGQMEETLPAGLRREHALAAAEFACRNIHFPRDEEALELARRRLIFEELFCLACGMALLRTRRTCAEGVPFSTPPVEEFLALLPFSLTAAQRRAMEEVAVDTASGAPMNRLVQGDVGSGKTMVAAYGAWLAAKNGGQCALMAPTELLAEQHFRSLAPLLGRAGVRVGLLTGAMTAAVHGLFLPGETVIVVNGGKFGERWSKIAAVRGLKVVEIDVAWGQAVTPAQVEQALREHPEAKGVFMQVCETSTAAQHPVEAIARLTRTREVLLVADGISAVGISPCPMDAWGIDCLLTGSQKGLMVPPGMALMALSARAWKRAESIPVSCFYFNLAGERDNLLKGQGLFTSPVNLIVGLHESLSMLFEEGGLDALYRKQWALTCMVRTGALALDLPLFAPTHYAWGVTSIMLPAGVDGDKLLKVAADECGIVFAGGQDHYKGRMVRFGHMGWVDWADALAGLHALAHGLRASGGFSASRDYLETALSAYHRALDVEPGRVIPDVRS